MVELNVGALLQELVEPLRREVALMQRVLERERQAQRELTELVVTPVDALFDLLQESASTMERQANALQAAGEALSETAALMQTQAVLMERTVAALHRPVGLVRSAAGLPAEGREPPAAPAEDRPAARAPQGRADGRSRSRRPPR